MEQELMLLDVSSGAEDEIDRKLQQINSELEKYTSHADRLDYIAAVACGILSGIVDSCYTGEFSLEKAREWGKEKTEKAVKWIAGKNGYKGDNIEGAILHLAERASHRDKEIKRGFHLAADSLMGEFGGARQHHLRDFAHHASITGLLFSLLTQFTCKCYGTDTSGKLLVVEVKDTTFIGRNVPEKLLYGIVYWFFHLVSDVAGSGNLNSEGTGIPGAILSFAKLLASTPLFKKQINAAGNREFSVYISKLFNGTLLGKRDENGKLIPLRFDFRTELGILNQVFRQAFPVVLNMVCVKAFYTIRRFVMEVQEKQISVFSELDQLDWNRIIPHKNRTIDRMHLVADMTFTTVDLGDAAIRAAFESAGNFVIFARHFVTRINYIGVGKAVCSIVKEISNEAKETQLIHERMLLTEEKARLVYQKLQEYKAKLDERLDSYLVEDIEAFVEGFDRINKGLETGDSDLVISGNVIIQRKLGREVQFASQKEFDSLMDSDVPLQL